MLRIAATNVDVHGTLKTYKGFPHGILATQAETINTDLLAFLKT